MGAGAIVNGGAPSGGGTLVYPCSVRGRWVQCHDNLEATAETSANLLKPWNITTSALHWVKVPDGATRMIGRAKNDAAATTVTTSPTVQFFGAYPARGDHDGLMAILDANGFSGTPGASNFAEFLVLSDSDGNTSFSLELATTGKLEDAGFEYSTPTGMIDLKGADFVCMAASVAANVTGGSAHGVYGEIMFLN